MPASMTVPGDPSVIPRQQSKTGAAPVVAHAATPVCPRCMVTAILLDDLEWKAVVTDALAVPPPESRLMSKKGWGADEVISNIFFMLQRGMRTVLYNGYGHGINGYPIADFKVKRHDSNIIFNEFDLQMGLLKPLSFKVYLGFQEYDQWCRGQPFQWQVGLVTWRLSSALQLTTFLKVLYSDPSLSSGIDESDSANESSMVSKLLQRTN
ncbi:hypothetical protein C8J56DRAFT_898761 [Mycena floridula]|nr:hypothetical protein C8J56DRAFT_898761 [Mycena floridula]